MRGHSDTVGSIGGLRTLRDSGGLRRGPLEGGGVFWVTLVTHPRGLDTRMFPKEGTARPCPLGGDRKFHGNGHWARRKR